MFFFYLLVGNGVNSCGLSGGLGTKYKETPSFESVGLKTETRKQFK